MKRSVQSAGLIIALLAIARESAFSVPITDPAILEPPRPIPLSSDRAETVIVRQPTPAMDLTTLAGFIPPLLDVSPEPHDGSRGVLADDDRVPMTSSHYPWSAIGQVVAVMPGGTSVCTGTLIAANVVLTNAHCVINPETHAPYSSEVYFLPNVVNGQVIDENDIAYVTTAIPATDFRDRPQPPHPDDWAFLVLDRPLGDLYGTIGLAPLSGFDLLQENLEGQLTLVGYSHDFPATNPGQTAGVHEGCSVTDVVDEVLFHDCDATQGASGGPLLGRIEGEYWIVGLNSAEWVNESGTGVMNFAVQIPRILNQVDQWIAER